MTNRAGCELEIDFSFFPEGNFQMDVYQDVVNAGRQGSDYKIVTAARLSGDVA
jgi:hypothetical protein